MLTRTTTKRTGPALLELFSINPHPPYLVEVCLKVAYGSINLLTNYFLWIKYKVYDQTIKKLEAGPYGHTDSDRGGREPPCNSGHTPLLFFRKVSAYSSFRVTSLIPIHPDIVNIFLLFFTGSASQITPISQGYLRWTRSMPACRKPLFFSDYARAPHRKTRWRGPVLP